MCAWTRLHGIQPLSSPAAVHTTVAVQPHCSSASSLVKVTVLLNVTSKASYQEISAVTSLCPIHTFCSGKPVHELMFTQFMYTPLQEVPSQHSDCSRLPKHLLQLLLPTWSMLPSCQHGTCIAFCTLHSPAYRTALFAVLPKDLVSLHFQSCSA